MEEELTSRKIGQVKVNYRLRDWGISRQRYWGCPIPIIHCEHCGDVAAPEADLPVRLPEDLIQMVVVIRWLKIPTLVNCHCPKCGAEARRETDTMDTFVDSSWYFTLYLCG